MIDSDKQKLMWLEAVKIYGNRPIKLLKIIIKNNLKKIIKLEWEYWIRILNSLYINLKMRNHTILDLEGKIQYW